MNIYIHKCKLYIYIYINRHNSFGLFCADFPRSALFIYILFDIFKWRITDHKSGKRTLVCLALSVKVCKLKNRKRISSSSSRVSTPTLPNWASWLDSRFWLTCRSTEAPELWCVALVIFTGYHGVLNSFFYIYIYKYSNHAYKKKHLLFNKKNFKPNFEDIVQSKHGGHAPFSCFTAAIHALCKCKATFDP